MFSVSVEFGALLLLIVAQKLLQHLVKRFSCPWLTLCLLKTNPNGTEKVHDLGL